MLKSHMNDSVIKKKATITLITLFMNVRLRRNVFQSKS